MPALILEEESLRDGLQAEREILGTDQKLDLIHALVSAGIKRIQVGSFVNRDLLPQVADTDELVWRIGELEGVLVTGLVLNDKGLERALACGLKHLSMSVSVSETHSQKNVRRSAAEALCNMTGLIAAAVDAGMTVRAGAQCAFGCVYEGTIEEDKILATLAAMADAGAQELNLADTTGMANPAQVNRLITKVQQTLPDRKLSLHLHDTRGLGLANMLAGYEAGVRIFDVAAGGLGGCPFVRGAAGNVATEDAVNLFERIGVDTGVNLAGLCQVVAQLENLLGRELPGKMCRVLRGLNCCKP